MCTLYAFILGQYLEQMLQLNPQVLRCLDSTWFRMLDFLVDEEGQCLHCQCPLEVRYISLSI